MCCPGVAPCLEPSRLVPEAQEAIAVTRSGYGPPALAQSATLDHTPVAPVAVVRWSILMLIHTHPLHPLPHNCGRF